MFGYNGASDCNNFLIEKYNGEVYLNIAHKTDKAFAVGTSYIMTSLDTKYFPIGDSVRQFRTVTHNYDGNVYPIDVVFNNSAGYWGISLINRGSTALPQGSLICLNITYMTESTILSS